MLKKNTVKPKFKIFLQSENTKTCEVCRHVTPTTSEPNSILQAESLDGHFDMVDELRVVSVTFTFAEVSDETISSDVVEYEKFDNISDVFLLYSRNAKDWKLYLRTLYVL